MSAPEKPSHDSPIKTPGQLITVLVLAFVVPIIVIMLLTQLVTGGKKMDKDSPMMSPEAVTQRIKPVAEITIGVAGTASGALKSGEEVYKAVCMTCHATGLANAPKFGDKRDWAPRIRAGHQALLQVALKGAGGMPPKGGATELSDIEIERSVVYMANAAGAKFKEPPAPAAATTAAATGAAMTAASPAAATGARPDGRKIYESTCAVCHAAGIAGAPKFGDKAAWGPHLVHGNDHLYQSVLKGKGAMPPKGGNLSLSDAEVRAALEYMVGAVK